MTDNVNETPAMAQAAARGIASATDRDRAIDALLSAAVLAADRRDEQEAERKRAFEAAQEALEREKREKMAERLNETLAAWSLAAPKLTADDLSDIGWEILPGLSIEADGRGLYAHSAYLTFSDVSSLPALGDAIRIHQAERARLEQLDKAEQEMEAKKPPLPTLPSVIPGSRTGTGVIFEPHGRFLTLRPFAPRDGSAGVAFAVEYISAAEARRLADAQPYRVVRVGDYLAAITPDSMTWLDDDGRTITVPLVANWSSLCAALRSWAGYADVLDAWEAECRKRGLTDY